MSADRKPACPSPHETLTPPGCNEDGIGEVPTIDPLLELILKDVVPEGTDEIPKEPIEVKLIDVRPTTNPLPMLLRGWH